MNRNSYTRPLKVLVGGLLITIVSFHACREEKYSLGNIPTPDFEVQAGADANTLVFVNSTPGTSIAYWETSTGQKFKGDNVSARFTFEGEYNVTLTAVTPGGTATITKQVSISQSDPTACNPDRALGFIAGCTEKVWRYNPEAGTFKVGDAGPDAGNWWSSTDGDVTGRACEFNDEFTFQFNAEGTFIYDNKGDFFADGYLGTKTTGCEPASNLSGDQTLWNSGTFNFSVIEGAGVNSLGQLVLTGKGAHIGIKKAHNGGETPTGPVGNSVTYDILAMEQNVGGKGYDILKLGVNIGGSGWWTFTLRAAAN
ncbi:hypothetical protein GCM10007415_05860 [Parapedobacter pyrenivorans]|uniref:PKD domain-containing protein n=1 Tax=Parapedobacter pyrenivorans TaxID=1305674 RepID=A0A917HFZ1_9SPHI|nr:PKD domain-containing protein [Parapedobacter pyrenivorans]GGG76853.1 hypothetical protein GCM10007415_05860 [Parapedobacter pyrenivorans]